MLEGLDHVEWANLWACGRATEIPSLMRAQVSPDATVRQEAWEDLYHLLVYQSLSITEATSYAVPFLLELLAASGTEDKAKFLMALAVITQGQPFMLGDGALNDYEDEASAPPDLQAKLATQRGWVQRAHDAVEQGIPLYVTLLTHQEAATRMYAAALLAIFPAQAPVSVPPLHAALAQEVDERAHAQIVMSLGTLLEPETAALHFLQTYLTADRPLLLRVAAAVATARRARAATPAEAVPILVEATAVADTLWPSSEQLPAGLLGPDYSLTATVRKTLAQVGPTQAVPALITVLHNLAAQGTERLLAAERAAEQAAELVAELVPAHGRFPLAERLRSPEEVAELELARERFTVAELMLAAAFSQGVPVPSPTRLVMRFIEAVRPHMHALYPFNLQERLEVDVTLEALQALLAAAWPGEQPLRAALLARPGAPALTQAQQMALHALVDEDGFWSNEGRSDLHEPEQRRQDRHNLLTGYGLPASRDTLHQLLALRGASVAEPLPPTLTPQQYWVVTVLVNQAVVWTDGDTDDDHELRRRLQQLLMDYDLPTSRAAVRDLLLG